MNKKPPHKNRGGFLLFLSFVVIVISREICRKIQGKRFQKEIYRHT